MIVALGNIDVVLTPEMLILIPPSFCITYQRMEESPPMSSSTSSSKPQPPRTFISKDIKQPDPIPLEGQEDALELMRTGRLFRYCNHAQGGTTTSSSSSSASAVSLCELEIAAYTGHQYSIGVNSCGSALLLMLKATDLKPGGKVLFNAFTFGAVPSAIEHAGGQVSLFV